MKKPDKDPPVRKSVSMPASMWRDVSQFQRDERITTEAEALRRIVSAWMKCMRKEGG